MDNYVDYMDNMSDSLFLWLFWSVSGNFRVIHMGNYVENVDKRGGKREFIWEIQLNLSSI